MKYKVVVVPPGGGEADHQVEVESPSVPQQGDYICLDRIDESVGFFKVRYALHMLKEPSSVREGQFLTDSIFVEVEPVDHPYNRGGYKDAVERYRIRGCPIEEYPQSGY